MYVVNGGSKMRNLPVNLLERVNFSLLNYILPTFSLDSLRKDVDTNIILLIAHGKLQHG